MVGPDGQNIQNHLGFTIKNSSGPVILFIAVFVLFEMTGPDGRFWLSKTYYFGRGGVVK